LTKIPFGPIFFHSAAKKVIIMKKLMTSLCYFSWAFSILVLGCAHPTDFEAGKFAAHTPEELVTNLSQAYQEKNVERYLGSFSGDCRFLYGGNYLWGKTHEQKIHQRLFGTAKSIELKLTEALNEEATETRRLSIYHYYLQIELRSEQTLEAQGMVELGMAKSSAGNWQINSFGELNVGLQKPAPTTSKTNAINNEVDYFPLRVGNQWIYEETIFPIPDIRTVVTDSVLIRGELYYSVQDFGYPFVTGFLRVDTLKQVRTFIPADSSEYVIFDLNADFNDSLIFVPPGASEIAVVELISRKDSVRVPAGTFQDVLEFLITDYNSGSRFQYEFAPDIGIIRQRGTNSELVLKSAQVNGIVVSVETRVLNWTQIKMSFN
jgi:hypothetical protein